MADTLIRTYHLATVVESGIHQIDGTFGLLLHIYGLFVMQLFSIGLCGKTLVLLQEFIPFQLYL